MEGPGKGTVIANRQSQAQLGGEEENNHMKETEDLGRRKKE